MDLADRLLPPQVADMSCDSGDQGITSICADFLVELRGFEMMAIVAISSSKTMVSHVPTVFGRLEAKPANG